MGEADIHFPAGGNDSVAIEAAVGPHRELSCSPAVAHPPHRLTEEVGGAAGRCWARPSRRRDISTSPVQAAMASSWVIPSRAGVAVVARSLLGQSIGLADGGVQVNGQGPVAGSRPRPATPGPATRGSPGRVDGRGPTGSCAGRCPGWMAP